MEELGGALGICFIFIVFLGWCFFCAGDPDIWDALDTYIKYRLEVPNGKDA